MGVRTFPITFAQSGDIVYPQFAYPYRGWLIPAWVMGLVSIGTPILVYALAQIQLKSVSGFCAAVTGTTWAVALATLFQITTKTLVGGFRPYFLTVCQPDPSRATNFPGAYNKTGLNKVGFQQVMFSIEICAQPDRHLLKVAMTGFPSGHSTVAFAGFGFLFLWLNAQLKVWADHQPAFWKLVVTMLPLLAAFIFAASLTINAAHNWYDIVGGSAIGAVMALVSFRATYAAVLDSKVNHVPLVKSGASRPREA